MLADFLQRVFGVVRVFVIGRPGKEVAGDAAQQRAQDFNILKQQVLSFAREVGAGNVLADAGFHHRSLGHFNAAQDAQFFNLKLQHGVSGLVYSVSVGVLLISVLLYLIPALPDAIPCLEQVTVCLESVTVCLESVTVCLESVTVCLESVTVCLEPVTVCLEQVTVCLEQVTGCLEQVIRPPELNCCPFGREIRFSALPSQ